MIREKASYFPSSQLNHLVSSEVRIGEQDKSKNTGGIGGHEILSYICVTFESCLCSSDINIELRYFCGEKMTAQENSAFCQQDKVTNYQFASMILIPFIFFICAYSNSLTTSILARVAGALVFYLFRGFAAIHCVHLTPLRKTTVRFEKYGHFIIVWLIFDVILRWLP